MQGSQIVNKVLFRASIKNKCKYANGFVWETAEIFFITFYLRKMYLLNRSVPLQLHSFFKIIEKAYPY